MNESNFHLTARPRILFRVRGSGGPEDTKLFFQMYGHSPATGAREFTRAYLTLGTPERRRWEAATSEEDRRTLHALVLLARANSLPPGSDAAKELYEVTLLLVPDYPAPKSVFSESKVLADPKRVAWMYPALLNTRIKKSRLVMFGKRGETFLPSILCPDIATAGFVYTSYRGVEVCPGCSQLFAPNPQRSQTYCSENCGQRIYQKRHRRRQKYR